MRCPYCVSDIDDAALACPRCTRDLYLFKPLLERIGALEAKLAEQAKGIAEGAEARIAALEKDLAELRERHAGAVPVEVVLQTEAAPEPPPGNYFGALALALIPAFLLLVAAHGILLFVYDVKPLILRVATLLIPVPFGVLIAMRHPGRFGLNAIAGLVLATLAVWTMLVVTATIDKVPVLPQDLRDARETIEYILGIGLAFITGVLLGQAWSAHKRKSLKPPRVVLLLAKAITPNEDGEFGIERAAKRLEKVVKAATPVATGVGSVWLGLKGFLSTLG
ncbi:MAG TPA: hypothetical protein VIS77_06700 [Burkholderiales bacterium]